MNVANLYVIADLDNMQVVGNVDEADIGQVKLGQGRDIHCRRLSRDGV